VSIDAYRNLHKKCISVRHRGRVQKCVASIKIANPKFIVGQGGRRRVLREKQERSRFRSR
jgi:hypothetical protein